jgi:enterochelin esterase-like enzyme
MNLLFRLITLLMLPSLTACGPALTPPALPPGCDEAGLIGSDKVPNPTQGFDISFRYYLPPCYDAANTGYPVIYLIAMPYEPRLDESANTPMSLADRLIRDRKLGPVLLVVPDDTIGYGYHAALALDLIPHVDDRFNTLPQPRFRGVGGISHGAAIAARMAFQFPDRFGSLGVFSGGISPGEAGRFDGWMASNSAETRPRVLIDVGDQDGILPLTENLLDTLDTRNVPYTLKRGAGGHNRAYWSARMESYLLWFAQTWE